MSVPLCTGRCSLREFLASIDINSQSHSSCPDLFEFPDPPSTYPVTSQGGWVNLSCKLNFHMPRPMLLDPQTGSGWLREHLLGRYCRREILSLLWGPLGFHHFPHLVICFFLFFYSSFFSLYVIVGSPCGQGWLGDSQGHLFHQSWFSLKSTGIIVQTPRSNCIQIWSQKSVSKSEQNL